LAAEKQYDGLELVAQQVRNRYVLLRVAELRLEMLHCFV
jgi:hypothetical protein